MADYILSIEQLSYQLRLNSKEGLRTWFKLADVGEKELSNLLPAEIDEYVGQYDVETQCEILIRIARIETDAHHFKQSLGYWDRVEKLGRKENQGKWVVEALVGKFNASWQVDPDKALTKYLLPAKTLSEKTVPDAIARVYYEIGFAYRQMQDMRSAIKWYEKAIREFRNRPEDDPLEAILLNDTGYVYAQLGRWGEATKYLNAALDIREDKLARAASLIESAKHEEEDSLRRAQSELAIFVGMSHNTLGEFHRHAENLDQALMNYDNAYIIFSNENNYYWQAKSLGGRGETYRRLALVAKTQNNKKYEDYVEKARIDMEESLYLCKKHQLDDERDTAYRRLGRLSHDFALAALNQNEIVLAQKKLEGAYEYFTRGFDDAKKTKEVLEELENITEMAFLLDDAIEVFGKNQVPDHYNNALGELENTLKKHANDKPRIHQFPVFEALLKLEQGAVMLANGDYNDSMKYYLEGYKALGTSPGYGVARYKQHFDHFKAQILKLPDKEKKYWCNKFIETWKKTLVPGTGNRTLADDDLNPDLVKWCNKLLKELSNNIGLK